jgi:ABC-type glycerol-3-phosphate transport system substrate-binding protein
LAVTAAAGSALAACAPKATPATKATPAKEATPKPTATPVPTPVPAEPIEMDYWYIWGGDGGKAMEAVSAEFEKQNPNVTMHPLAIGGEILDKSIASFAAGTPPDVVDLILCAPLAARDALVSVEEYLNTSAVIKEDNYYDAQWDGTKWAGSRYGLPANEGLGWIGLFRNRGLVQKAGLDEDNLPATFDDLSKWADALTEVDDDGRVATLGCDISGMLTYPDCMSVVMGLRYFDGETMQYTYDDERWVEALNITKSFYDKVGPENIADFKASFSGQAIANPAHAGKVGLWNTGSWGPGGLDLNAADDVEWGVSFMPDGVGEGAKPFFAGTHVLMMFKGSNADVAWKFLEYSSTLEYIKRVYDISGFIMGTKSFIQSLDVSTLYPGLDFFTTGQDKGTRVWGLAADPNWYLNLFEYIALEEAVGFGKISPEEGLANLQKLATEELAKLTDS